VGNKDNEGFQYLFSGKAESRYGSWLFLENYIKDFVLVGIAKRDITVSKHPDKPVN
jgi:hypothetical protein